MFLAAEPTPENLPGSGGDRQCLDQDTIQTTSGSTTVVTSQTDSPAS